MTVGELIQKLSAFPEKWPVLVGGYESGYDEPDEPSEVLCVREPNGPAYKGEYQVHRAIEHADLEPILCIRLSRARAGDSE